MLTRQKVRGRVDYWRRKLGLTEYTLRVRFDRPTEEHAAHCDLVDRDYLQGELYFSLTKIHPRDLDAYILHELSHVAFWPIGACAATIAGRSKKLRRLVLMAEEQSTTRLERVLLRAFGLTKDAA